MMGQRQVMKQITSLVVLLGLAACGGEKTERAIATPDGKMKIEQNGDSGKIIATTANGTATFSAGGANAWPAQTAPYAPAYPGATVTASFSGNSGEGDGGMVTFTTPDSPDKVIDFYKARAEAEGLGKVSNLDFNGTKMFGAGDDASGRTLSVQTSTEQGKTTAAITYSTKRK